MGNGRWEVDVDRPIHMVLRRKTLIYVDQGRERYAPSVSVSPRISNWREVMWTRDRLTILKKWYEFGPSQATWDAEGSSVSWEEWKIRLGDLSSRIPVERKERTDP